MTERFDSVVIGGGMAGLPLALRAARHERVALIERERLGGTCLNRGCIPTKTMIASAAVAHSARTAGAFGVRLGDPEVDLPSVVDRKDTVVDAIRQGSYRAVGKSDGLELIEGEAHLVGDRRLRVGDVTIEADKILLNTGTRDATGGIDGLGRVPHLTSRTILDLREMPEHLIVIGGGFIGCEFAQMFRRFGARVTVVQRADRLLPAEDPDISGAVAAGFDAEGIDVHTSTTCTQVGGTPGELHVVCRGGRDVEMVGTHLLVAVGRVPNSDGLGLEHLDVEPDASGFLPVDARLRVLGTDGVWALGDLRGGDMFTHTARDDADIVYRNVYRDDDRTITARVVPHAVFVSPEVGAVGLTEPQARAAGYDVDVGTQAFDGVARARAMGQTIGLVKFVVDRATDHLLGCHVAGPHGSDLVHEGALAMVTGARYSDIRDMLHVHPSLAEGMNAAAGGVHRPSAE